MKFYILLVIIGAVVADSSIKETENQVIYFHNEDRVYRIIREDDKPKRTEFVSSGEERQEMMETFTQLAARLEKIIEDSEKSWGQSIVELRKELGYYSQEVQQMLQVIYPFLQGSQIVEHVKLRAARNIGHGAQPNGPRPGNYNPYGNANERPHQGHQGHQGHHQQHRPKHH